MKQIHKISLILSIALVILILFLAGCAKEKAQKQIEEIKEEEKIPVLEGNLQNVCKNISDPDFVFKSESSNPLGIECLYYCALNISKENTTKALEICEKAHWYTLKKGPFDRRDSCRNIINSTWNFSLDERFIPYCTKIYG